MTHPHFLIGGYFCFRRIIRVTPARIATIPSASCRVKDSPKIQTPITTAVTGSKAPMMAAGVLPMRLMEIVMKKSESTVGKRASWAAQSHCFGVSNIWKLSPDIHVKRATVIRPNTNIQKVNLTFDMVLFFHWLMEMI